MRLQLAVCQENEYRYAIALSSEISYKARSGSLSIIDH